MIEKWVERGRKFQDLSSDIFCLTTPSFFAGDRFSLSIFLGIEKFYA